LDIFLYSPLILELHAKLLHQEQTPQLLYINEICKASLFSFLYAVSLLPNTGPQFSAVYSESRLTILYSSFDDFDMQVKLKPLVYRDTFPMCSSRKTRGEEGLTYSANSSESYYLVNS
jgi:hypothetical protein